MNGKKIVISLLCLASLVVLVAATPNLAMAQTRLQTPEMSRLHTQTPGSCLPSATCPQTQTQTGKQTAITPAPQPRTQSQTQTSYTTSPAGVPQRPQDRTQSHWK